MFRLGTFSEHFSSFSISVSFALWSKNTGAGGARRSNTHIVFDFNRSSFVFKYLLLSVAATYQ